MNAGEQLPADMLVCTVIQSQSRPDLLTRSHPTPASYSKDKTFQTHTHTHTHVHRRRTQLLCQRWVIFRCFRYLLPLLSHVAALIRVDVGIVQDKVLAYIYLHICRYIFECHNSNHAIARPNGRKTMIYSLCFGKFSSAQSFILTQPFQPLFFSLPK